MSATSGMPSLASAVLDNVEWCDLVCRSLEVGTGRSDTLWWTTDDAPSLFPDVIVHQPSISADRLLALLDDRPRCSVKDSFAELDLTGEGFEVLFEATWIGRAPGVPEDPDPGWRSMIDADGLAAWDAAWLDAGGAVGGLSARLLATAPVVFLADVADVADSVHRVIGGAAVHRSREMLGLSNVFSAGDDAETWRRASVATGWLAPECAIVGYEHGPAVLAAGAVGFRPLGPLRVWQRG